MAAAKPESAFELNADHVRYLHRLLARLHIREDDIHDVAQTVMLAAHRSLSDFRGSAAPETWLYRICVREARRHRLQARGRPWTSIEELEIPCGEPTPLEELLQSERRLSLQARVHELTPEQQEVLVMHDIEERPMREVAVKLGCPLQTAYTRLRGARRALGVGQAAPGNDNAQAVARVSKHGKERRL